MQQDFVVVSIWDLIDVDRGGKKAGEEDRPKILASPSSSSITDLRRDRAEIRDARCTLPTMHRTAHCTAQLIQPLILSSSLELGRHTSW